MNLLSRFLKNFFMHHPEVFSCLKKEIVNEIIDSEHISQRKARAYTNTMMTDHLNNYNHVIRIKHDPVPNLKMGHDSALTMDTSQERDI